MTFRLIPFSANVILITCSFILGAFIGSGDVAIANNIMDMTCRIQAWAFGNGRLPELLRSLFILRLFHVIIC